MFKFIKFERIEDKIALLTISRPEVLNALNMDVLLELECAIFSAENDGSVKVVILTGAGDKAFVAGADIGQMKDFSPLEAENFARLGQRITLQMESSSKIFIACVNGYALGGGLELAMACDIVVADERAELGQPEINLGLIPGFGGTQRLSRIAGTKRACELVFTGRRISAKEAKEMGIVNLVAEPGKALEKAFEIARLISSKPAISLKKAKESIMKGIDLPLVSALELEGKNFSLLFSTHDSIEGMKAFLEKRKPSFKDS